MQKKINEAKTFKIVDPNEKPANPAGKAIDDAARSVTGGKANGIVKPLGAEKKQKENEPTICACGKANPEHRGYCTECVTRLKETFDKLKERYTVVADDYE